MVYYYYHKDYYGTEKSYVVEPEILLSDKQTTLDMLATDAFPYEYQEGGNFWGYSTLEDLRENEESNEYAQAYAQAVQDALDSGMQFPFYIISHADDRPEEKYEVCTPEQFESEIDGLIHEYAESHAYKIEPCYYAEGEITAEEAKKQGMYSLADVIETEARFSECGYII